MALSWPSAVRLLVAAILLVAVGVALFTFPVEKVRLYPPPLVANRFVWDSVSAVLGLATS